ncbi:MAG: Hpt domain-containing protein [Pseudomonadota bacterium]
MAIFAFSPREEILAPPAGPAPGERPVDLVHLSRQSLGDRALEQEILSLFRCQTRLYLERLENAATLSERRMAAHTILGSARGIGAHKVAAAAEYVEQAGCTQIDLTALEEAVGEANAYIDMLLD